MKKRCEKYYQIMDVILLNMVRETMINGLAL